jgi:hypothetical protein
VPFVVLVRTDHARTALSRNTIMAAEPISVCIAGQRQRARAHTAPMASMKNR